MAAQLVVLLGGGASSRGGGRLSGGGFTLSGGGTLLSGGGFTPSGGGFTLLSGGGLPLSAGGLLPSGRVRCRPHAMLTLMINMPHTTHIIIRDIRECICAFPLCLVIQDHRS